MPLSEHEKTEFERLTADINFGDPVALKEKENHHEETTPRVVSPRRIKWWTAALIWLGLAIIPAVYVYVKRGSILDAFASLVFCWVFLAATGYAGNPKRNGRIIRPLK